MSAVTIWDIPKTESSYEGLQTGGWRTNIPLCRRSVSRVCRRLFANIKKNPVLFCVGDHFVDTGLPLRAFVVRNLHKGGCLAVCHSSGSRATRASACHGSCCLFSRGFWALSAGTSCAGCLFPARRRNDLFFDRDWWWANAWKWYWLTEGGREEIYIYSY